MADVATISLEVKTAGLENGEKALKSFRSAAADVSSTNKDLNSSFKAGEKYRDDVVKSLKDGQKAAKGQAETLQDLLDKLNPTNKAFEELDSITKRLATANHKGLLPTEEFLDYNAILEDARDKLYKMNLSLTSEGRALLEQEAATKRAQIAGKQFVESLKGQTEELGKTRTELLEIKAAQLGVSQQAAPFIAKLKMQEKAFMNGAISIGQYKQAMRMLPMQMTDVVTSLASGMPIWMVAIQQGGQIKDSFGGIGNSFKAVLSLITPVRLAMLGMVGAAGALAIAAYKGSMELGEYNRQLILTGGYAGKTASQLNTLSKQLSGNGITRSTMASALASVVGSGAFNGSAVDMIASTAAKMQETVGQSVDETIKQFQRLKDDPVKAVQELDKSLHFLTASQLEQIMTLERQGDTQKAAQVAMESYSAAMNQRMGEIKDNLGTLEQWWKAVGNAASNAWDQMLNVGRAQSTQDQLTEQTRRLEILKKQYEDATKISTPDTTGYGHGRQSASYMNQNAARNLQSIKSEIDNVTKRIENLNAQVEAENKAAERLVTEQKIIESVKYKNDLIREGMSNEAKRAADLVKLWAEVAKAPEKWTQKDREDAVATINNRYNDKGSSVKTNYGTSLTENAEKAVLALQTQLRVLKDHQGTTEVISAERKKLWEMEAQISILEEAQSYRKLTTNEQSLLLQQKSVLASQQVLAAVGDEVEAQKQKNNLLEQQHKRIAEIEASTRAMEGSAGLSNRQYQRNIAFEKAKSPEETEALEKRYAKEDSLRANWEKGIQKGFSEFQDKATNVYSNVASISEYAFQGMSDSLANFLTTGEGDFKQFTTSVLSMIVKMLTQMAILEAMKSAFGGTDIGGFFGGVGYASGGYTGDGGKYEPKGIVHGGEFVFTKESTARLGKDNLYRLMKGYSSGGYVGSHVNTPNLPVSRLTNNNSAPNVNVNLGGIHIQGEQQQSQQGSITDMRAAEKALTDKVKSVLLKESREGGDLYKIIKYVK